MVINIFFFLTIEPNSFALFSLILDYEWFTSMTTVNATWQQYQLGIYNLLFTGFSTEFICKLPDDRGGAPAVFDCLGPLFKDDPIDDDIFIHIQTKKKPHRYSISQSFTFCQLASMHARRSTSSSLEFSSCITPTNNFQLYRNLSKSDKHAC